MIAGRRAQLSTAEDEILVVQHPGVLENDLENDKIVNNRIDDT